VTSRRASGYRKSSASGDEWTLGERRPSHGHPRPAVDRRWWLAKDLAAVPSAGKSYADAWYHYPLKGASAVRTQGPSTRTKHPTGHARARGPSLAHCASEGRCGIRIVDRLYWSLQ
jgi:hypothetical protein